MSIYRGQIYFLKPDKSGKSRPVVVVSNDLLNGGHSVLAIPFYSQQLQKRSTQQWCVQYAAGEGNLPKDCVTKTDQLTLIDKADIDIAQGPIGRFTDAQLARLADGIKWTLSIS